MNALARTTDPETSHLAAEHVVSSGLHAIQKHQALQAVKNFPGRTSHELAAAIGGGTETRYMLARRLADLEHDKKVCKGGTRDCRITGHKASTWYLVDQQPPVAEAA